MLALPLTSKLSANPMWPELANGHIHLTTIKLANAYHHCCVGLNIFYSGIKYTRIGYRVRLNVRHYLLHIICLNWYNNIFSMVLNSHSNHSLLPLFSEVAMHNSSTSISITWTLLRRPQCTPTARRPPTSTSRQTSYKSSQTSMQTSTSM